RPGVVALIERRADDRRAARAAAAGTLVAERAGVAVGARRAVGLRRVRAHAGTRVARADLMALIERTTDHRVRAGARAAAALVGLRAGVGVVASRSVRLVRVG